MRKPSLNINSLAIIRSFGEDVFSAIKDLRAREQFAIIMRYGLSRHEPRTYKDIAAALGISISRAQNIERSGISKLRHLSERKNNFGDR